MIAHPFGQMAVMMDLIAGGVLDRYSTLRVGFFESGLGWIPYWLDRLDEHFEVMGHHTPWLKRRPSEIFASQCFVSMEPDEAKGLAWMAEKVPPKYILCGSGGPQCRSTYPASHSAAKKTSDGTGEQLESRLVAATPLTYHRLWYQTRDPARH